MSNIIYLDDYRKEVLEEETELRNPILLGWDEDDKPTHVKLRRDTAKFTALALNNESVFIKDMNINTKF